MIGVTALFLVGSIALALSSRDDPPRVGVPAAAPADDAASVVPVEDGIVLDLDPPEATVVVNGEVVKALPSGATVIARPRGGAMATVLVKAPGYVEQVMLVDEATVSPHRVKLLPRKDAR